MGCFKFDSGVIRNYSFYLRKILQTQRFFIFSNDIQWCIDNFNNSENMIFVDWNTGNMDFCDIFLIYFLFTQKNIPDDNKGMFGREDSLRITENKELDDKKINLIESK